ncbi:protein APCDD1 isoform X1 [Xylocopa sonorina]|uniref:protein APCDD1 isoform X1 n=2 Tax=Xylocopa sonorina TaxID=1818115 RepID=UPI00403B0830
MKILVAVTILCLITGFDYMICLKAEKEDDHCETMMRRIDSDDRATLADNTPVRLHSTWVSQECEVRAGPKYIIRKYSFFKNDTFLLLQYHYAEESCSIATYTITARGSIEILSSSVTVPGARETKVQLDSVHLIPLNRQVAHKFGRRMNVSCGGIESKWRPYLPQLIYERPIDFSSNANLQMHDLNSNSLQSRLLRSRKRHTLDCLETFDIDFTELRLLRIEIKRFNFATNLSRHNTSNTNKTRERVELLFGGLARNVHSQKTQSRPNRLQSTPLIRGDTAIDCPICGSVYRATEYSPPLFHQAPSLPAVINGFWMSIRCESVDGGAWSKRFFQIYSHDNRWTARWTYYADSKCANPLYTVHAAGIYIQRAVRQTRDAEQPNIKTFENNVQNNLEDLIMLRENRRQKMKIGLESIDRIIPFLVPKDYTMPPSGTTELDLRVLESLLIPVNKIVPTSCESTLSGVRGIRRIRRNGADLWSQNCIHRIIKAPAIFKYKARIGLDWKGDYILLLASWKNDLWEAPLRRCSITTSQSHFKESWHRYMSLPRKSILYDRFTRYRRHWFPSSANIYFSRNSFLIYSTILLLLYWLHFVCNEL